MSKSLPGDFPSTRHIVVDDSLFPAGRRLWSEDQQGQDSKQNGGNDDPDHDFSATPGRSRGAPFLEGVNERKAFDHRPYMWCLAELLGQVPSSLVVGGMEAVLPTGAG